MFFFHLFKMRKPSHVKWPPYLSKNFTLPEKCRNHEGDSRRERETREKKHRLDSTPTLFALKKEKKRNKQIQVYSLS